MDDKNELSRMIKTSIDRGRRIMNIPDELVDAMGWPEACYVYGSIAPDGHLTLEADPTVFHGRFKQSATYNRLAIPIDTVDGYLRDVKVTARPGSKVLLVKFF